MTESQIKDWLEASDRDRHWLAEQCGVSKPTVDGWLSAGRTIPAPALKLIHRLMHGPGSINPILTLVEFQAAQQAARTAGLTLDAWISRLIRDEIARPKTGYDTSPNPVLKLEKVAEEGPKYHAPEKTPATSEPVKHPYDNQFPATKPSTETKKLRVTGPN
jgi:hypothetical protein